MYTKGYFKPEGEPLISCNYYRYLCKVIIESIAQRKKNTLLSPTDFFHMEICNEKYFFAINFFSHKKIAKLQFTEISIK